MPNTVPGLFIGWRIERGIRHRGILYIADYDAFRTKGISPRFVRSVPFQEVYFPENITYPYAEARERAIRDMSATEALPPVQPLPFAIEAGEAEAPEIPELGRHAPAAPRFKITLQRMLKYDTTPGCRACDEVAPFGVSHTPECRARFRALLEADGLIDKADADPAGEAEEPVDPISGPGDKGRNERDHAPFAPPFSNEQDPAEREEELDMFAGEEADDDATVRDVAPSIFVQHEMHVTEEATPSASEALAATLRRPKEINKGLSAACAAIDDIYDETMLFYNEVTAKAIFAAAVDKVKGAKTSATMGQDNVRPSERLKGFRHVFEINMTSYSNMDNILQDYDSLSHHNVECLRTLPEQIKAYPGCYLHATLPARAWSPASWERLRSASAVERRKIRAERSLSLIAFRYFARGADACLKQGGRVSFAYPAKASIWLQDEVISMLHRQNLSTVEISSKGQTWRVATSSDRQARNLLKLAQQPSVVDADAAEGSTSPDVEPESCEGISSKAVTRSLLSSLYEYLPCAPCLPCAPAVAHPHREMEPDEMFCGMAVPTAWHFGYDDSEPQPGEASYAMVTHLLDRKEVRGNEQAHEAIRKEGAALKECGTWDEASVCERDDLLSRTRAQNKTIHIGDLMTLCSIKFYEMSPELHRYKGRIVFRGDSTKDQHGASAVFQELGSSPTSVQDVNCNLAYGAVPGNATTAADAQRAYVQADLKSKFETWVSIPRELWPAAWHSKGFHRPMCLLKKALYGHPESGGHWEAHLTKAVVAIGGKPVPDHPSSFFFPDSKLLLTVYVDDLLLSGPEKEHDKLWKLLSTKVNLDEPEPLGRFLGRHHDCTKSKNGGSIEFNMEDYCLDAVRLYTDITGVQKYKEVPTPFLPDGSISEEDEESKGELSDNCCRVLMKALWLARLSRPDIIKPIGDLATRIQRWTRGDDKRLYRLICYLYSSPHFRLEGHIGDPLDQLYLMLFVDADFCGEKEDTKSTSGSYLVLKGPNSFFPLWWSSKRQTSTSRSTTEAEVVSLASALFSEGLPMMSLWDMLTGRKILLKVEEDNQATIKVVLKGYSPKLRHILRTHKVNLGSIKEVFDEDSAIIEYIVTTEQAADIFTKALAPLKWHNALQLLNVKYFEQPARATAPRSKASAAAPRI